MKDISEKPKGGSMNSNTEFETLLERNRIVVERYINFRLQTRADADDVIQETYLAAFSAFSELKNKELFRSWILSIAKNKCNLWFRKEASVRIVALEEIADSVSYEDESTLCLDEAIKKLPSDYAEVLELVSRGYKQTEIATRLSLPLGTVKSRLFYAKKKLQNIYGAEEGALYLKGRKNMTQDHTCGFPTSIPRLTVAECSRPFEEFRFADEAFIIPKVGNRNSEGTYRYPDGKLALVSTSYVPKEAIIHGALGVKVCRDTYNFRLGRLFKNECVWFSQLTDEYIRDLGTICGDAEGDTENPTEIFTFLEEDYDICVNGSDRVHGRPLLVKENPPKISNGKLCAEEFNVWYTLGAYDLTVGKRTFETFKLLRIHNENLVTESYVTKEGRLVLLRWYESEAESVYAENAVKLVVNGVNYILTEDRISEYAL